VISPLVLAAALVQASTPPLRLVVHDFKCQLRTSAGKIVTVSGEYTVRETPTGRGIIDVHVQSGDKAWGFLKADTTANFRPGPDWIRIMFDFTDPATENDGKLGALDDQKYTLDLSFPARAMELRGRFGFAVLRDQKDDTPLVWEARPYPITAIGPCDLDFKMKAAA